MFDSDLYINKISLAVTIYETIDISILHCFQGLLDESITNA